jgi:hypothetical protein
MQRTARRPSGESASDGMSAQFSGHRGREPQAHLPIGFPKGAGRWVSRVNIPHRRGVAGNRLGRHACPSRGGCAVSLSIRRCAGQTDRPVAERCVPRSGALLPHEESNAARGYTRCLPAIAPTWPVSRMAAVSLGNTPIQKMGGVWYALRFGIGRSAKHAQA